MSRGKALLVHHFALSGITGVTALLSQVLRIVSVGHPDIEISYRSYEACADPEEFIRMLDAEYRDVDCIIGINLHIEVLWDFSLALGRWCATRSIPLVDYVHDYWPHHFDYLRQLKSQAGVRLVGTSPFIIDLLQRDGFRAGYVPVGAQIPEVAFLPVRTGRKIIASCGRLTKRKRFPDVVQAFSRGNLDSAAQLFLRLLPSRVFQSDQDDELLRAVRAEIEKGKLKADAFEIVMTPTDHPDYSPFSIYVCASDYEGFSMAPFEAAYSGCPPIVSDIPPHRLMTASLFGERAEEFLYPVTDTMALAERLQDELTTGRRRLYLEAHLDRIQALIRERFSVYTTARALVDLCSQLNDFQTEGSSDERLGLASSRGEDLRISEVPGKA